MIRVPAYTPHAEGDLSLLPRAHVSTSRFEGAKLGGVFWYLSSWIQHPHRWSLFLLLAGKPVLRGGGQVAWAICLGLGQQAGTGMAACALSTAAGYEAAAEVIPLCE